MPRCRLGCKLRPNICVIRAAVVNVTFTPPSYSPRPPVSLLVPFAHFYKHDQPQERTAPAMLLHARVCRILLQVPHETRFQLSLLIRQGLPSALCHICHGGICARPPHATLHRSQEHSCWPTESSLQPTLSLTPTPSTATASLRCHCNAEHHCNVERHCTAASVSVMAWLSCVQPCNKFRESGLDTTQLKSRDPLAWLASATLENWPCPAKGGMAGVIGGTCTSSQVQVGGGTFPTQQFLAYISR